MEATMETALSIGQTLVQTMFVLMIFGCMTLVACAPCLIPMRTRYTPDGRGVYEEWKPGVAKKQQGKILLFDIVFMAVIFLAVRFGPYILSLLPVWLQGMLVFALSTGALPLLVLLYYFRKELAQNQKENHDDEGEHFIPG